MKNKLIIFNEKIGTYLIKFSSFIKEFKYLVVIFLISIFIILNIIEYFKWDRDFGFADLINVTLALLTLTAVRYSKIAAESAKESTELSKQSISHTEEQTRMLAIDFETKNKPKLLPDEKVFQFPLFKFPKPEEDFAPGFYDALNLSITNTFYGHAYNVSAWLYIDDNKIDSYCHKDTPRFYKQHFNDDYSFKVYKGIDGEPIIFSIFNDVDSSYEENTLAPLSKNMLVTKYINTHPVIKHGENIKIDVPLHIHTIIGDTLYDRISRTSPFTSDDLELHITYKTSTDLDNNGVHIRKYKVDISHPYLSDNHHINFSIKYNFLNEIFENHS